AAEDRDADARVAVRRLQLRAGAHGQAGVLGAVPPGGLAGAARQPLSVPPLRRIDAAGQRSKKAQDRVASHLVMAGLVPAISIRLAWCSPKRGHRDKPGGDTYIRFAACPIGSTSTTSSTR